MMKHPFVLPVMLVLLSIAAFSQTIDKDYSDSPLNQWYKSLKNPITGISCCDISDCTTYPSRTIDDHWEILYEGTWWRVPDDVILKDKSNPAGEAVACFRKYTNADHSTYIKWFCFVPPFMV